VRFELGYLPARVREHLKGLVRHDEKLGERSCDVVVVYSSSVQHGLLYGSRLSLSIIVPVFVVRVGKVEFVGEIPHASGTG
jgi:hypothetical protein